MGDKNSVAQTEGNADLLVKSGHSILKSIYTAQTGDRVWIIRDGLTVCPATGTVIVACPVANTFACGTVTACCVLEERTACGTITVSCALVEATATGTVTQACAVGEVHGFGTMTMVCSTIQSTACGTVTLVAALACDTVTINGLVYTAVTGAMCGNAQFSIDGTDTADAADLVCAITNDTRCGTCTCGFTATNCAGVVTYVSVVAAAAANCITAVSSNACRLAISACGFTCGKDADTVVINCLTYTAVAGAKMCCAEYSIDTSNCLAATDLADSICMDARAGGLDDLCASSCATVVTATAITGGTAGNAITLTSTAGARITLSGATFSGGVNGDFVTLNGLVYTATVGARANDTQFSIDTSNCAAAIDLTAALNADCRTGTLQDLTSTSCAAVSTLIPTCSGTAANSITLATSCAANLTISGATMTGGVDADTVTLNGLLYTASCMTTPCCGLFDVCGETNCAAAVNLDTAISCDCRAGVLNDLTATNCANVVTISSSVSGAASNAITMATTDICTLTVSGATLSGGNDACTVTVNGLVYTAVCGAGACMNFSTDTSNNATATDLALRINCDCTAGTTGDVTAAAMCAVVTITTDVLGTAGNAITLVSSCMCSLLTSGATFTGGVTADTVTVNGLIYLAVDTCECACGEWDITGTCCQAATALAAAFAADCRNPCCATICTHAVTGAAVAATVTITADAGAVGDCITLVSSNATRLLTSGATLCGGIGAEVIEIDLVGATSGEISMPYFNHPMRDGIFIDYISGTTGRLGIIYE